MDKAYLSSSLSWCEAFGKQFCCNVVRMILYLLMTRVEIRLASNYAFAKYAWMSVVQPQLVLASDGRDATHWMIESNTNAKITKGVIEMLMRHIQTEVKKENSAGRKFVQDVHFDVSVRATVRRAVLMYGSSHTFTNPLVEVKFTDVAVNALALLSSKTKWFVPTREVNLAPVNTMQDIENSGGNGITFQSTVSAEYLNTRHDHMEQFIESYPCFGGLTYQVFLEQTSSASRDEEESEGKLAGEMWVLMCKSYRCFLITYTHTFGSIFIYVSRGLSSFSEHQHFEIILRNSFLSQEELRPIRSHQIQGAIIR